jgi:AcrR family transcriptional regulator
MPKNRRDIDADSKRAEILRCAEALFRERGYQAATMTALARLVGIAPNAIYWYFPSKDHVLTAVLERSHERLFQALEQDDSLGRNLEKTLAVVLSQARALRPLIEAVRARAGHSPVVTDFRREFHRRLSLLLANALKQASASRRERELLGVAMMAIVEGALIYESSKYPAEEIVTAIVRGLIQIERTDAGGAPAT